ncbi:TonB-dependent receptor [soil metagenome]
MLDTTGIEFKNKKSFATPESFNRGSDRSMILFTILFVFFFNLSANYIHAQQSGILKGKVLDRETQNPIRNATLVILNNDQTTATDSSGEFIFNDLIYDTYRLKISAEGYSPVIRTDLTVYASKPLEVLIQLNSQNITTETIDVEANYFQKSSDINTSSMNLDFEEIRRAPGATEDISRMLQTAPGVSIGNDQRNDIIVRGGSPSENLLVIDGIEIPNINHFNTQGSTSGAIGFINVKFIQEANIFTGGFPARFGDKSSGVIDVKFREGSRKKFYSDINLSIGGFGGVFEGPLFSEKGSYMISVRRSYLELLKSAIQLSAVPNFWDINLKMNYDLSPNDKLLLIGFSGIDKINFDGNKNDDLDDPYGKAISNQNTYVLGLNYKKIFGKGFLETVLSTSISDYNINAYDTFTDSLKFSDIANESEYVLKSQLNYQLGDRFIFNGGVGGKLANFNNDVYAKKDTTYAGYIREDLIFNNSKSIYKLFADASLTSKFLNEKLTVNVGARIDYFDYIRLNTTFSPRLGISYKLFPSTSLNGSYGIFYQTPTYLWLAADERNKNLNSIRAEHFILGVEQFLTKDIRFTAEVYQKNYKDYPVPVNNPVVILIDGGSDFGPNLISYSQSAGTGYVRGVDVSFHKKLTGSGFYGLFTYSYMYSRFKAIAGNEKPGAYDSEHQFTLISGYQAANDWLFGFKIKYSSGKPYTPFDFAASTAANRGIFSTNDYNSFRYAYYLRIDIRIDKKINFKKSSLVGYIEIQNLFNKDNVNSYFWNQDKNAQGTIKNWKFLPVGGFSFQF